jgi:hypothetical protein
LRSQSDAIGFDRGMQIRPICLAFARNCRLALPHGEDALRDLGKDAHGIAHGLSLSAKSPFGGGESGPNSALFSKQITRSTMSMRHSGL